MQNFILSVGAASIFGLGVVTALSWSFNAIHKGWHTLSRKVRRATHRKTA